MEKSEVLSLLSELLGQPVEAIQESAIEIPGVGYFAAEQFRGGRQCIVGFDGGRLFGASSLSVDQMEAAYRSGTRTP